ncbi:MAG: hypothetical protein KDJ52_30190, partial [Anaerolineae bacterium]|nr:hypothetical protein [Anaerolineae bacterium]
MIEAKVISFESTKVHFYCPKVTKDQPLNNFSNLNRRLEIRDWEIGVNSIIKPLPLWAGITALCLVAFVVITLISHHIFEHVPHSEDEVAYLFQAKVLAENRLTVPTPPQAHAFWSPFVIDYEQQRFGKYPPGWPLLLSLGIRLGAPWLVNAGLATVSLALIGWLGYRYYCTDEANEPHCLVPLLAVGL